MPGSAALWVVVAVAVFGLAVGLTFGLSGGGDGEAGAAPSVAATTPLPGEAEDGADRSDGATAQADPVEADSGGETAVEEPPAVEDGPATAASALTGFVLPIDSACLPAVEGHLPGAPRTYRNGIHEGVDFYSDASCTAVTQNTPVLAAKAGIVVRADRTYQDLTVADLDAAAAAGYQGEAVLDMFRGRQIWIDHGGGVVSRFAHLSAVAAGIEAGDRVRAGQVIGFVGESGTPESVLAPGSDYHLHFEIREGDSYLGADLAPSAARALYLTAFGIVEGGIVEGDRNGADAP